MGIKRRLKKELALCYKNYNKKRVSEIKHQMSLYKKSKKELDKINDRFRHPQIDKICEEYNICMSGVGKNAFLKLHRGRIALLPVNFQIFKIINEIGVKITLDNWNSFPVWCLK